MKKIAFEINQNYILENPNWKLILQKTLYFWILRWNFLTKNIDKKYRKSSSDLILNENEYFYARHDCSVLKSYIEKNTVVIP